MSSEAKLSWSIQDGIVTHMSSTTEIHPEAFLFTWSLILQAPMHSLSLSSRTVRLLCAGWLPRPQKLMPSGLPKVWHCHFPHIISIKGSHRAKVTLMLGGDHARVLKQKQSSLGANFGDKLLPMIL